jgi:hypothetical protein
VVAYCSRWLNSFFFWLNGGLTVEVSGVTRNLGSRIIGVLQGVWRASVRVGNNMSHIVWA